jgi:hypothetical protein
MPWQCYNAGAVALAAHSLGILQDERVPLQQCTSLFAQLLVMLRGACVTCWCYYVMIQSDLSVCAASAAGQTAGVFEVLPGVDKMCHFCPYTHRLHTHATIVLPVVVLTPKNCRLTTTLTPTQPLCAALRFALVIGPLLFQTCSADSTSSCWMSWQLRGRALQVSYYRKCHWEHSHPVCHSVCAVVKQPPPLSVSLSPLLVQCLMVFVIQSF